MPQSPNLLILGSGTSLWDDLSRYDSIHGDQDRMGVNFTIVHYQGRLQHGVSVHDEELDWWAGFRQRFLQPEVDGRMIAHYRLLPTAKVAYQPARAWDINTPSGSSSFFGVMVALALGYEKIILAGVPMDRQGDFYWPHPYDYWGVFGSTWEMAAKEIFQGRVKSLSGKTMEILGEP